MKTAKEAVVTLRYNLATHSFDVLEKQQSYERGWDERPKRTHDSYELALYDAQVRMSRLRLAGYLTWLDDQAKHFWRDILNVSNKSE